MTVRKGKETIDKKKLKLHKKSSTYKRTYNALEWMRKKNLEYIGT